MEHVSLLEIIAGRCLENKEGDAVLIDMAVVVVVVMLSSPLLSRRISPRDRSTVVLVMIGE